MCAVEMATFQCCRHSLLVWASAPFIATFRSIQMNERSIAQDTPSPQRHFSRSSVPTRNFCVLLQQIDGTAPSQGFVGAAVGPQYAPANGPAACSLVISTGPGTQVGNRFSAVARYIMRFGLVRPRMGLCCCLKASTTTYYVTGTINKQCCSGLTEVPSTMLCNLSLVHSYQRQGPVAVAPCCPCTGFHPHQQFYND